MYNCTYCIYVYMCVSVHTEHGAEFKKAINNLLTIIIYFA